MFEKNQSGIGSKYDYTKPQDLTEYMNAGFTHTKYNTLLSQDRPTAIQHINEFYSCMILPALLIIY